MTKEESGARCHGANPICTTVRLWRDLRGTNDDENGLNGRARVKSGCITPYRLYFSMMIVLHFQHPYKYLVPLCVLLLSSGIRS
jgi:hypothetical protein